jgi:hypothetical protein
VNDKCGTDHPSVIKKGTAHHLWRGEIHAASEVVTSLCQAWTDEATTKGISAVYDPHHSSTSCTCSYHFDLPFKEHAFGLLLSFWWEIRSGSDCHTLDAFLMAGQDIENADEIILQPCELDEVMRCCNTIVDNIQASLTAEPKLHWSLFCLGGAFQNEKAANAGEHRVFRTRLAADGTRLTPVALAYPGARAFQSHLGAVSLRVELVALLEILVQNPVKVTPVPQSNRGAGDPIVFDACPTDDQVDELIPGATIHDTLPINITEWAAAVVRVVESGKMRERANRQIANAIYAFRDGQRARRTAPTLAGIALFASLASFARQRVCDGVVTCSNCGKIAPHATTGEVNRVIAYLDTVLEGIEWPREDLRRVLKHYHTTNRSAFVHAASLQFSPADDQLAETPLYPVSSGIVHPDVLALESLQTVWQVARFVLLKELSAWDVAFQDAFDEARKGIKPSRMGPISRLRLKPRWTRPFMPIPAQYRRESERG